MRRRLALGLSGLLLVPPLLYLALRIGLLTPFVNLALRHALGESSPLRVRVGRLRCDVFSFVEVDDLLVMAPVRGALLPLLSVDSLRVDYRGWKALRGRVDWAHCVRVARVRGLNVFLLRGANGDWNISALIAPQKVVGPGQTLPPLPLPATRLELQDSRVVLVDEPRGFRASLQHLEGSLDTRALPWVTYSLTGSTDNKRRRNFSVSGKLNRSSRVHDARLDLDDVELARYLNYFLPRGGLAFTQGRAALSVRLHQGSTGPMQATGKAQLQGGALRIPAINQPLEGLTGAVVFDPRSLRFSNTQAHFLGADWQASGTIEDLRHPILGVHIQGNQVPLAVLSQQVKGLGLLRLSGTAAVDAVLTGPAHRPLIQARLWAPRLGLLGAQLQGLSASARLEGTRLRVSGLRARLWGGALAGSAEMGLAQGGRLDAELSLDGASLGQATLDGRRPLPLEGLAQGTLKAAGLLRNPVLDLDLTLPSASLGSLNLGALTAQAHWGPDGLDSHFKALGGRLQGRVAFSRGRTAAFHDSRISLKAVDLSSTAAGLAGAGDSMVLPSGAVRAGAVLQDRLRGTLDAVLNLEGPLQAPQVWVDATLKGGRLMLPLGGPLALRDPEAGLRLFLVGALGFHQGEIQWGRPQAPLKAVLGGQGSGGIVLQALGRYPLDGAGAPGHLSLDLAGDLRLLDALSLFNHTEGRISGDLLLSGTPDSPSANGQLQVKGFQSDPTAYLGPLRRGGLTLQMRGQAVHLVGLTLQAGGQLSASGEASLAQGWQGLSGSITFNTDDLGLRLDHWAGFGNGSVKLEGLKLSVDGPDSPLSIAGRAVLSNALVVYGGQDATTAAVAGPAQPRRPLTLDLRIGVGANVWYEKHQPPVVDITQASSMLDPSAWLQQTFGNLVESIRRPDLYFRLAPTAQDFLVQGSSPDIRLLGQLAIDRGRITMLENEFQIRQDAQPALIRFNGRHGEVQATAVGHLRYMATDPVTQRTYQKSVDVSVLVSPMSQDELLRSGLQDSFLNYKLDYSSDPVLDPRGDDENRQAILHLIVLGDPMVDSGSGSASALGATQLDRLISAELRKQIATLSQHGFKLIGSRFVDVFRVVPRLRVLGSTAAQPVASGAPAAQGQGSSLVLSDLTVELGKSLTDQLYASLQGVYFNQEAAAQEGLYGPNNQALDANYASTDWGGRIGLEYQISSSRTLEAYYNYAVDDNLDPLPQLAGNPPSWGWSLRFRNTLATDNYTPELADERRWGPAPGARP